MPLDSLPDALLQTIINRIACLLLAGAGGDMEAARIAATATISAFAPETDAELRLAARIIAFDLQAGEALAQAANPDMPIARVLRLRSGAVSLTRESQKAERQLNNLRRNREDVQPELAPVPPRVENAAALVEDNRKIGEYASAHGVSWTRAMNQQEHERRLAKRQAKLANRAARNATPQAQACLKIQAQACQTRLPAPA